MMFRVVGLFCIAAALLCANGAEAQTPDKPDTYIAIDQCKAVKPPDGAYEESHMEYHCTLRFALSDASKGKACLLVTTTPTPAASLPCQSRNEQRAEEPIVFTVGAPPKSVYQLMQSGSVLGAVTVLWDDAHEWLTITGNYGGNYKATSPCAGTTGGSC